MNAKMRETSSNYDKMLFREGLRTGFFEMQGVRDKYRELCGSSGMSARLVRQFIEWQAVALAPVCPHIADYVWRRLLEKPQSVLRAGWPSVPSEVNPNESVFIKSSEYLMEAARDFRLKLKAACQPAKAKKGQAAPKAAKRPTHATLYVAKTYPPWQCAVLSTLKAMYEKSDQPPDNKQISVELGKVSTVQRCSPFRSINFKMELDP